ncbi:MAG: hypothetical protein WAU82_08645, partial [Candidatus Binatus sp.]|uniref:hypothetical protein n=1 Tax=Candidatus Binatus sp. TaxID=2811406 RepID=UPI003BB04B76
FAHPHRQIRRVTEQGHLEGLRISRVSCQRAPTRDSQALELQCLAQSQGSLAFPRTCSYSSPDQLFPLNADTNSRENDAIINAFELGFEPERECRLTWMFFFILKVIIAPFDLPLRHLTQADQYGIVRTPQ